MTWLDYNNPNAQCSQWVMRNISSFGLVDNSIWSCQKLSVLNLKSVKLLMAGMEKSRKNRFSAEGKKNVSGKVTVVIILHNFSFRTADCGAPIMKHPCLFLAVDFRCTLFLIYLQNWTVLLIRKKQLLFALYNILSTMWFLVVHLEGTMYKI